ncbi:MAG TPA: AAA family ATPase [Rhizomicrobium sp.]|nr:AAA family ATPase [Rhizomicrobium sp.]
MLIAFAGLPSAGKSTTAKALADRLGVRWFVEPEEDQWPEAVRDRDRVGRFTALTWFRSVRVPKLYAAAQASRSEHAAVIDSYYDVLLSRYIGEDPFSWLLDPGDPYFPLARHMAELDWQLLPHADFLVFLRLDERVWNTFMNRRARDFDRAAHLKEQFAMQALMEHACRQAEVEHGTRLIVIDQEDSTPAATAVRVAAFLPSIV